MADTRKWLESLTDPIAERLRYESLVNAAAPMAEAAGNLLQGLPVEQFRESQNVSQEPFIPPLPRVDWGHRATDLSSDDTFYNAALRNELQRRYPGPGVYPLDPQTRQDIELSPFETLFAKRAQYR